MDPSEFLKLAHTLKKHANNEAALRTSVSRSYYSYFNYVCDVIVKQGLTLPEGAAKHKWVELYLQECGMADMVLLASNLADLRTERNCADYDMSLDKFDVLHSTGMYLKAKTAYDGFQKLMGNSANRKKVRRGILEYCQKIQPPTK